MYYQQEAVDLAYLQDLDGFDRVSVSAVTLKFKAEALGLSQYVSMEYRQIGTHAQPIIA